MKRRLLTFGRIVFDSTSANYYRILHPSIVIPDHESEHVIYQSITSSRLQGVGFAEKGKFLEAGSLWICPRSRFVEDGRFFMVDGETKSNIVRLASDPSVTFALKDLMELQKNNSGNNFELSKP